MNSPEKKDSAMSSARKKILEQLRSGRPDFPAQQSITVSTEPDWPVEERIERFRNMMESTRAEVHLVTKDNWTEKLISLCQEKNLENLLYSPTGPLGKSIAAAWQQHTATPRLITHEADVDEWKEEIFFGIDAAITSTRGGIADTGTLVIWPTPDEPRSLSLVPPVHFALLEVEKLHNTFAEVLETEAWNRQMPTNALLISGPSKSADIEQTLAYGVHGPVELVILLAR